MGTCFTEVILLRSSSFLLAIVALQLVACTQKAGLVPEPLQAVAPELPLERVPGTYVGTMLTASGVEAVVLEIREIVPAVEGFSFHYRIRDRQTGEEGVGTMQPRETATQVCFDSKACGWLLVVNDNVHISAKPKSDGMLPVWSLEKQ